jgi:hypothetical protein
MFVRVYYGYDDRINPCGLLFIGVTYVEIYIPHFLMFH